MNELPPRSPRSPAEKAQHDDLIKEIDRAIDKLKKTQRGLERARRLYTDRLEGTSEPGRH